MLDDSGSAFQGGSISLSCWSAMPYLPTPSSPDMLLEALCAYFGILVQLPWASDSWSAPLSMLKVSADMYKSCARQDTSTDLCLAAAHQMCNWGHKSCARTVALRAGSL